MDRVVLPLLLLALMGPPARTALAQVDSTDAPAPRRWVVQVGAGSPHAWNFVGVTRELRDGSLRPFVTAGLGSFLVGGGVAGYTNPRGTGLVLSAAVGVVGAQIAGALDARLSPRVGIVLGGSYGSYFMQYEGPLLIASVQARL